MLKLEHFVIYDVSHYGYFLEKLDDISKQGLRCYISEINISSSILGDGLCFNYVLSFEDWDDFTSDDLPVSDYVMTMIKEFKERDVDDLPFVLDEDFMEVVHQYHNMNRL